MIIHGTSKFISAAFDSEKELERVVQVNAEYIFGPDSIYLDKKSLIRSPEGFGTIPDGFGEPKYIGTRRMALGREVSRSSDSWTSTYEEKKISTKICPVRAERRL